MDTPERNRLEEWPDRLQAALARLLRCRVALRLVCAHYDAPVAAGQECSGGGFTRIDCCLPDEGDDAGLAALLNNPFFRDRLGASACIAQPEKMLTVLRVDVDHAILQTMIDRLLGGGEVAASPENEPSPPGELTEVEQWLAARVARTLFSQIAVRTLAEEPQVGVVSPAGVGVSAAQPEDRTYSRFDFEIRLGESAAGEIRLGVPRDRFGLYALTEAAIAEFDPEAAEVTVRLARTGLSIAELMQLAEGDIISSDKPVDGELLVNIDGNPAFFGRLETHDGRRHLTIERQIDDLEEIIGE